MIDSIVGEPFFLLKDANAAGAGAGERIGTFALRVFEKEALVIAGEATTAPVPNSIRDFRRSKDPVVEVLVTEAGRGASESADEEYG